ncbi:hypothetical protein H310_02976 [Aphanomyces invadans]|uniref:WRKY transcription factor 19 n=1 Tax=Aphanomyces invadans TaxID=157072 RepID=A0A024UKL1_9STRA|nr:hypothetical protein H310_02976 [Aphanomyces invadans]ETW06839.1 hypothetical protein H310_02976 [Aphanomyces invadans]|eukprot:XP_008864914.1 hypothetical protein H310_02976 [Aphanomyces invadans]
METCHFNGCEEKVRPGTQKCTFHRKKGICSVSECRNQVYARGLCVRHGARKPCEFPDCDGFARYGGFCCKHGDKYTMKECVEEGCVNKAHARQRCVRHGGGRKCKRPGCDSHARCNGFCSKHMETAMTAESLVSLAKPFLSRPSMRDICAALEPQFSHTALDTSPLATRKLPSIKLTYEYKPYFVVNA